MISPDGLTVLRFDCLFEQIGYEDKQGSVDLRLCDIVVRKGGGRGRGLREMQRNSLNSKNLTFR